MKSKPFLKIFGLIFFGVCGIAIFLFRPCSNCCQNPISSIKNPSLSIQESLVDFSSDGIKIIPFSEDFIETNDIGFKKWILCFENLNNSDCTSLEMKRLFTQKQDKFEPLSSYTHDSRAFSDQTPPFQMKSGKKNPFPNSNLILVFSEKGFLPGEKITLRGKKADSEEYETISFYPRPIALYEESGKMLAYAELKSLNPMYHYVVHLAYNPNNRLWRFQSHSGDEHIDQFIFQDEPIETIYIPSTVNSSGGKSSIILTYQNGDVYTLSIPWGDEMIPYASGVK